MEKNNLDNLKEKYEENQINDYAKSGSSFLEYTKMRKKLGIDKIQTVDDTNSIKYLQRKHVEYLKEQSNRISSDSRKKVGYDATSIFKNSEAIFEEKEEIKNVEDKSEDIADTVKENSELTMDNNRKKALEEYSSAEKIEFNPERKSRTRKRNVTKDYKNKSYLKKNNTNKQSEENRKEKEATAEGSFGSMLTQVYLRKKTNNWNEYGKQIDESERKRQMLKKDEGILEGVRISGGYIATKDFEKTRRENRERIVEEKEMEKERYLQSIKNPKLVENMKKPIEKKNEIYNNNNITIEKMQEQYRKNIREMEEYAHNTINKKERDLEVEAINQKEELKKQLEDKLEDKIKKINEDIMSKRKMEEKEVFLTAEGYAKLEEELRRLKTEERDAIAERIKIAKSYGDLSENAEYDEAKSSQEANENKIAELEIMIKHAKIIDESNMDTNTVQVGSTVYITNIATKKEQKYTIVGVREANVLEGKISNESPIAKSLLGAKVGDVVQVEAPVGIVEYKIKNITLN